MIQLTKLNNAPLIVNSDLIKFVEQAPDTVITLITGEKIIVRENASDVVSRVIEFRCAVAKASGGVWDSSYLRKIAASHETSNEET